MTTAPSTAHALGVAEAADRIHHMPGTAAMIRALAADRDRLAAQRDAAEEAMVHSDRHYSAIARRIEEMATWEPTRDERDAIINAWGQPSQGGILARWNRVCLMVRDAILATPAPEPPSSPRCGLATASEGPTCDNAPLYSDGETYHCPRCDKDFTEREPCMGPAPQPSPATPRADWEDLARSLYLVAFPDGGNDWDGALAPKALWFRVAAEVSKREARLREEADRLTKLALKYHSKVVRQRKRAEQAEDDLAASRAQLAEANTALKHLRPALQAANEGKLRLLKMLDEAKRRSVS